MTSFGLSVKYINSVGNSSGISSLGGLLKSVLLSKRQLMLVIKCTTALSVINKTAHAVTMCECVSVCAPVCVCVCVCVSVCRCLSSSWHLSWNGSQEKTSLITVGGNHFAINYKAKVCYYRTFQKAICYSFKKLLGYFKKCCMLSKNTRALFLLWWVVFLMKFDKQSQSIPLTAEIQNGIV